jgi:hypothetical protein
MATLECIAIAPTALSSFVEDEAKLTAKASLSGLFGVSIAFARARSIVHWPTHEKMGRAMQEPDTAKLIASGQVQGLACRPASSADGCSFV